MRKSGSDLREEAVSERSAMAEVAILSRQLRENGYVKLADGRWKQKHESGKFAQIRSNKRTRRFEIVYLESL